MTSGTTTNTIGTPDKPLSISDLDKVLMDHTRVPVGMFVSQQQWNAIEARWRTESRGLNLLVPTPTTWNGLKIAVDPSLPATEFNVAFTEEAWAKRLREIRGAVGEVAPGKEGL